MALLLSLILNVAMDGGKRGAKELLDDSQFLGETLGVSLIFSMIWMFIKLIFKKRS